MKTFIYLSTLIFLSLSGQSQEPDRGIKNDPATTKLLESVSDKYHEHDAMSIQFLLIVDAPEEEVHIKSIGTVYLKGKKYKIDTEEMMIICDNIKRYVYLKESNELQINYYEPEEGEIESPSELFDIYKKDYFYRLVGELNLNDHQVKLIELIPKDIKSSTYSRIQLFINSKEKTIEKAEIHGRDGIKYTYGITEFNTNPELSDSEFVFDPSKYKDIYIDDMTK